MQIYIMHLEAGYVMMLMVFHLVQASDYLVAVPQKFFGTSGFWLEVSAKADETGGTLHYHSPKHGWRKSTSIRPGNDQRIVIRPSIGTISGIENKAVLFECSNSRSSLNVNSYMSFAPLPTTALGTKYRVPSCYQNGYSSLLLIAAHNRTTSVSIKARSPIFGPNFNRQDTHTFELKPFQTFTYEHSSDLTGTLVNSTQPVAVFSGMSDYEKLTGYDQLLPFRLFDTEYVVAVDDNAAIYHLQILSEQKDTVITFNNGSSLTMQDNVHQYSLKPHESLYFKSSNPVMASLCRRNEIQRGFMVVPPVSLYSMHVVSLNSDSIFMTQKDTFINSSGIRWTSISNSGYKIGVLEGGFFTTKAYGCNLVFSSTYIRKDGVTFAQSNQIEVRKSFLVALPDWTKTDEANLQLGSSQSASYQVVFPHHNLTQTRQILARSSDNFYLKEEMKVQAGIKKKAILVDVDSEETQLSVILEDLMYGGTKWQSTIFPTSLLGKEYILQACSSNTSSGFQLIIVSSSSGTDINILLKQGITYDDVEYRTGDTIRVRLQPYHTLTINSSVALCGTSVSAAHEVAVFILSIFGEMISYNQLLPVEEFGENYIVVANDEDGYFNSDYYMLVTDGTGLTEVGFSYDLKVSIGDVVSYQKDVIRDESVYFTSTKPVTTSLCNSHSHQCTVIVPTKLYTRESMFDVQRETVLNILTESVKAKVNLMWSSTYETYENVSIAITWATHKDYKIGTAIVQSGNIFVSSTDRFTTFAFTEDPYRGVIPWNLIGWAKQTDGNVAATVNDVNTMAVAIGTGIVILILLAVVIYQQIYIRRSTAHPTEKTEGTSGEHETSFSQVKPKDNEDVSTGTNNVGYSDLHTENNYESFNHSASVEAEADYETF